MKNKLEQGRSMVEMLGVLAIIGVLSIGGIAGYTYAMNKHRTNVLINGALLRGYTVVGQLMSGRTTTSLSEFNGEEVTIGGTFANNIIDDGAGGFGILISGVNEAVCKNMIKAVSESASIKAVTKEYDIDNPLTESDCNGGNKNFFVVFNKSLSK